MNQIPESVRRRMQSQAAGEHPDADLLTAFAEQARLALPAAKWGGFPGATVRAGRGGGRARSDELVSLAGRALDGGCGDSDRRGRSGVSADAAPDNGRICAGNACIPTGPKCGDCC